MKCLDGDPLIFWTSVASDHPAHVLELARIVTLDPEVLTFVVEALPHVPVDRQDEARAAVLALADHANPLIREGALLALPYWAAHVEVMTTIRRMTRDTSPLVAKIARSLVAELQDVEER